MTRTGRYSIAVAVGTLTVLAGSLVVGASESTIADSFPKAGSYSGSTGAKPWSGPWVEETDDGSPSNGDIRVATANCGASGCLGIDHVLLKSHSIYRVADLEGAETATIRVSLSKSGLGTGSIRIYAVGSATEDQIIQVTSETPQTVQFDISAAISSNTLIRFETFGVGALSFKVIVDNVRIDLVYPDPTTTTSTSTTLPSLPTTTVAVSPTTSAPSSNSTTTRPSSTTTQGSSTTSTEDSRTTTTLPSGRSATDQPPLATATGFDLELASVSGVTLNLVPDAPADLGFSFGVNPVTGLTVNFLSVVEIIKAEFLSALGLGTMVAFFVVGGWKKEDEEDDEDEKDHS